MVPAVPPVVHVNAPRAVASAGVFLIWPVAVYPVRSTLVLSGFCTRTIIVKSSPAYRFRSTSTGWALMVVVGPTTVSSGAAGGGGARRAVGGGAAISRPP